MKKFFLIAFTFLLLHQICRGQVFQNLQGAEQDEYFEYLYNFNFTKADSCLKNLRYSNATSEYFMYVNYYWWLLITSNERQYVVRTLVYVYKGLESLRTGTLLPSEKAFMQVVFESFRFRVLLYNKQYFGSFLQTRRLAALAYKNLGLEKSDLQHSLNTALFHYFGDFGKNRYPLLFRNKIYSAANRDTGFHYFYNAQTADGLFVKVEATYYLQKILFEIEKRYESSMIYSACLANRFGRNIIFRYNHLSCLLNMTKSKEARSFYIETLSEIYKNKSLSNAQKQHLTVIVQNLYSQKSEKSF